VKAQAKDWAGGRSEWSAAQEVQVAAGTELWTTKWRFRVGPRDMASPALGRDGTIYVSGTNGMLALDPDGRLRWSYECDPADPSVTGDGSVCFVSEDKYVNLLYADGTVAWRFPCDAYSSYGCPAIDTDGTVYVPGFYDSNLYAINADGTLKWRYSAGRSNFEEPVIALDGTVYSTSWRMESLYAFYPDSQVKWTFPNSLNCAPSIGDDGTIYLSGLLAVNQDGTLKWQSSGSGPNSSIIGPDGEIYLAAVDAFLYTIGPEGDVKRKVNILGATGSTPAIAADGTVFVGCDAGLVAVGLDGVVHILASGRVASSPVIALDGTIYAVIGDRLVAFNGSFPLADSPWPMYHHDPQHTARAGR
jgi:outer membrane protein assembly factor BamB